MSEPAQVFDVVVVGAGPAGIAAACTAAESGRTVALVDDTPWLGGQIWRGKTARSASRHSAAQRWCSRLANSGTSLFTQTTVVAAPEPGMLLAERATGPCQLRWSRLVLATGARELFLPFPGWTLPGVVGPGGLQNLVKTGWPIARSRVAVAGTGPLLLAVAAGLRQHGAEVIALAEQASRSRVLGFGLALRSHPSKLVQGMRLLLGLAGVPRYFGAWAVKAEGNQRVEQVTLTNGAHTWSLSCDYLACGFGLVPNVELPLLLGCELTDGFVRVDSLQATTVPNVYCAGEPAGIGGADCALLEGQIAGYAAAGDSAEAERLFAARRNAHRFRQALARTFALRPELLSLAGDSTVLCRCEDVTLGQVRRFHSWREAKLHSRCGMGACQGRTCGAAAKLLLGWGMESIRPPILPAKVETLITDSISSTELVQPNKLLRAPAPAPSVQTVVTEASNP